jgi:hypothetical protein
LKEATRRRSPRIRNKHVNPTESLLGASKDGINVGFPAHIRGYCGDVHRSSAQLDRYCVKLGSAAGTQHKPMAAAGERLGCA